jgi:Fur family transcriptional regulator, ferric uptake regulator
VDNFSLPGRITGPTSTTGPTIGPVDTTLKSTLHQKGLRMTPQRQLVLEAVRELGHATPEQICARVQSAAPAVNITTVYRTLDLLEELRLVRHTHLGHGAPKYSEREHEHVHLVCHSCGAVGEAPTGVMEELAAQLRAKQGFALDVTHVALSGLCAECASAEEGE